MSLFREICKHLIIFFFEYRFEENLSNIQKYNKLKRICDKMKSENIEIRPSCDQILRSKQKWSTNLDDFKDYIQSERCFEYQSIEVSFHKYFIHQKLKYCKIELNNNHHQNGIV